MKIILALIITLILTGKYGLEIKQPVLAGETAKISKQPISTHQQIRTGKKTTDIPRELKGTASYYSTTGCLGCSPSLTMANGETLDDTKLTIALTPVIINRYKLMNKLVKVIHGQKWIIAKVTDSGGFAKYNRVADLSLETKKQLNCPSLCNVRIEF